MDEVGESLLDIDRIKGQATKSVGWMPWHQKPMKDVISCDKLRVGANSRLSRRFLNGETHLEITTRY